MGQRQRAARFKAMNYEVRRQSELARTLNFDAGQFEYRSCVRKKRYPKEAKARIAAAFVSGREEKDLDVYECKFCKGWHLTSQPKQPKPRQYEARV